MLRTSFLTALLVLIPSVTLALDLDTAKTKGFVGETRSGYLAAVSPNPSPKVETLVSDINGKRKTKYQQIASSNGTSLEAVEKLAGQKAIKKTPAGQFIQKPNGAWVKK